MHVSIEPAMDLGMDILMVSPMDPPVDSLVDPAVDPTVDLGLDSGMDLGLDSGMDFSWISHGFFGPILCRAGYYFGTEKSTAPEAKKSTHRFYENPRPGKNIPRRLRAPRGELRQVVGSRSGVWKVELRPMGFSARGHAEQHLQVVAVIPRS